MRRPGMAGSASPARPRARLLLAYHEAGHAIGGLLTGTGIALVTLRPPRASQEGYCAFRPLYPAALRADEDHTRRLALGLPIDPPRAIRAARMIDRGVWRSLYRRAILRSLAGPVAEIIAAHQLRCDGDRPAVGWSGDLRVAMNLIAARVVADRSALAPRRAARHEGRYLFAVSRALAAEFQRPTVWAAVEALAGALDREGTLSGRRVRRELRRAMKGQARIRTRWGRVGFPEMLLG